MSKQPATSPSKKPDTNLAQNQKLLSAIQSQIPFLLNFNTQQINQLSSKSHIFVFSVGTIIAVENEVIDYIGVIIEGKVQVFGENQKRGPGYFIGDMGYNGLMEKQSTGIVGASDGIIMAIRIQELNLFSKEVRNVIHRYAVRKSIESLKNTGDMQANYHPQQLEQRKVSSLYSPQIKSLLCQTLQTKERQTLLKHFPIQQYSSKSKILHKTDSPCLLLVIKGQLIIKPQAIENGSNIKMIETKAVTQQNNRILAGQIFNSQTFLMNYSLHVNVYCFSQEAIVIKIQRQIMENVLDLGTIAKIDGFLMKKEISQKKYEVVTAEVRREREKQNSKSGNNKWTVFTKQNYQILPLNIPKKAQKQKQKQKQTKTKKQPTMGTLFRQQVESKKQLKTNTSTGSKISKILTMKTEKNQQKTNSVQQQLQDLKKQMDGLNTKLKFYEENYIKQFRAKYQMGAVLKEISSLGQRKFKQTNNNNNFMTLKKAFEQSMKENKIMEVVARCAYKWLWLTRKKKGVSKLKLTK